MALCGMPPMPISVADMLFHLLESGWGLNPSWGTRDQRPKDDVAETFIVDVMHNIDLQVCLFYCSSTRDLMIQCRQTIESFLMVHTMYA